MDILAESSLPLSELITSLGVDEEKGLNQNQVQNKLKISGPNELDKKRLHWHEVFLRQFKSAFIYLLIGAGLVSLALGETNDGLMIYLFLLINVLLGFFQEYRSERTIELLKNLVAFEVKTLRDGRVLAVPAENLVPGDVIFLVTGDKIPADVRFLQADNLLVDESTITGESQAVFKSNEKPTEAPKDFFAAKNLGFAGTLVLSGSAKAVVLSTGRNTVMGGISHLTNNAKAASAFEKGINGFSIFILKLIFLTMGAIFFANVVLRPNTFNLVELLLFFIALTVSVIPEALPLVTTFSLSYSARKLAHQQVIVKRLSAVEDLGSVEIFCSDKTGTLTENKLKLEEAWGENREKLIFYANLALSDIKKEKTEPFDLALNEALPEVQRSRVATYARIYEESFNPQTKRNAVVVGNLNAAEIILRGAPENLLALCNLESARQKEIETWFKRQGAQGQRLLAVARRQFSGTDEQLHGFMKNLQSDFEFLGVLAFSDPIKPTTQAAVQAAKKLGVQVKIITGDSPEVAGAVAEAIGLVKSADEVITSYELLQMEEGDYADALEKFSVFARVTPEEKFSIISTLQKKFEVGFLGEGINDAPALKAAGVSVVVDSASDIAREVADIILLDKSLGVIVDGIQEGRNIFANTTKYIKATLASNFGNFFSVASTSLFIPFLPMLPLQILLINLLSDFPMIAICTDRVDADELKTPRRYEVKEVVIVTSLLGVVSSVFDFMFFGLFYRISPEVLRTNWFIGSILTELVFIFAIRTKKSFLRAAPPSVPLIFFTILGALLTVVIPFSDFGHRVFGFVSPTSAHLVIIFVIVFVYFLVSEAVKRFYYHHFSVSN